MTDTKSLFIVVSQTNTLTSRIIQFYTRAPFNHISLSLDENLDRMYSFARRNPPRAFPSGFMQESMEKSLFGMMDYVPCQIYKLNVSDNQYNSVMRIIDEFNKISDDYKFNVLGFVSMILKLKLRRAKRFMCSQFVAYVLSNSEIIDFGKDYSLVTPEDIRTNENLVMVFDGNLKEYVNRKVLA